MGEEEDGGGQQELHTEDSDAVGQPAVLRAPVLHAVGPLLDAEGEYYVGSEVNDVKPSVGDYGGGTQRGAEPDYNDEGDTNHHAASGPDGVEDHMVSVQGYQADGEG